MFIGLPIVAILLGGLTALTAGIGGCIAMPLYVYFVYRQAKSGASNDFLP